MPMGSPHLDQPAITIGHVDDGGLVSHHASQPAIRGRAEDAAPNREAATRRCQCSVRERELQGFLGCVEPQQQHAVTPWIACLDELAYGAPARGGLCFELPPGRPNADVVEALEDANGGVPIDVAA